MYIGKLLLYKQIITKIAMTNSYSSLSWELHINIRGSVGNVIIYKWVKEIKQHYDNLLVDGGGEGPTTKVLS